MCLPLSPCLTEAWWNSSGLKTSYESLWEHQVEQGDDGEDHTTDLDHVLLTFVWAYSRHGMLAMIAEGSDLITGT